VDEDDFGRGGLSWRRGYEPGLEDLLAVALMAALAPVAVAILPGPRVPQVVVFRLGGILTGPYVRAW
jgi:hypothetical protein